MHVLGLMHPRRFCSIWVATALSLGKCHEGGGVWGVSSHQCFVFFSLSLHVLLHHLKFFTIIIPATLTCITLYLSICPFLHLTCTDGCTTPVNDWG